MLVLRTEEARPVRQQPKSSRIPLTRDPITYEAAKVINRVSPAATKAADSFPHRPIYNRTQNPWGGYSVCSVIKGLVDRCMNPICRSDIG